MNFDWAIVGMLQTYTNVAWVIDPIVMQMAVDISPKATYGLRVDGDMGQNDLVAIMILLDNVRPDIIEERKILIDLEDIVVALDKN